MVQKLQIGDKAPEFAVQDVSGHEVSLRGQADTKPADFMLVAFLRYAGCPWCNLAIHRLTMESALLHDSGCAITAFVQSSKQNIVTNIFERHSRTPDFPIVADRNRHIYEQYAVRPSMVQSLRHITNVPHWVHAVRKEGFGQTTIDGNLFLAPAMFLVNVRNGLVVRADYSSNLYEHATFTMLYDAISAERRDMALS